MIAGLGIDICAVDEIEPLIANACVATVDTSSDQEKKNFDPEKRTVLLSMFTSQEIERARTRPASAEHLAGVFAAKEAVFKAFGVGWESGVTLNEVEVGAESTGQPVVTLHGRFKELLDGYARGNEKAEILVTISHDAGVAVAAAVLDVPDAG